MEMFLKLDFWFTVFRCATPVLFATMAAMIADRSGILNLGMEGAMAIASLSGVLASGFSGNLLVGGFVGLFCGTLFTMILAYFIMNMKANQVIAGIAMNLAASGGSIFALYSITGDKNTSNSIQSKAFPSVEIPVLKDIPVLGDILSGHNVLTYLAFILAIVLFIVLKKTKFGFKVRAVGESPEAAESVGIKVHRVRYQTMFLSGLLASFGGIYMSMGYINRWTAGMIAGRGYIALATNAMAAGNSLLGMFASLLYGFGSSIAIYLQNMNMDPYMVTMIPYLAIIVFYVLFSLYYRHKNKQHESL
ncbi:MAG: ABC transporter permease [Lachnospiraceae bacterium]|nr:ABC transporter permease [Lachnospiraceae bacterium]